jgi:hypothetical protein
MAKLSARGRTQLAAVVRTFTVPEDDEFGRQPGATIKHELRLMSDGIVLEKHVHYFPNGNKDFAYGWAVHSRWFKRQLDTSIPSRLAKQEARGYTAN